RSGRRHAREARRYRRRRRRRERRGEGPDAEALRWAGDGEVSVGAGGDEHAALDVAVAVRLFVAVELGERARAAIAEEQGRLRAIAAKGSRVRWVGPEQLHLTLVFLGEVDPARAAGVVQAIGRPIERAPIELTFAGIGAFPPRGAPRALWIGLR